MITLKPDLPANGMTYSQRKRLLSLLWALVSNWLPPFILGFVVSLVAVTHALVETVTAYEKSGFGVCIQPELPVGGEK